MKKQFLTLALLVLLAGNGPFTIASENILKPMKTLSFSLTMPQRGAHWYKGTGYTITWTTGGLDTPVRLDLVKLDGSTHVKLIAKNIPNNGKHFWVVPMSLPDAETLYRMRIRTMDKAHSDTPAAFYIAKAKPPAGPPAIKVGAPGGQLGTGFTYPIRWTSTCGKSVKGPSDDAFDIELMNAAGTARVRWLLQSGLATYDGGNRDGSHSWHWDWQVPWNETAGTYRIRVTNMSGHCAGLGELFYLVYQQEVKEYVLNTVSIKNCYYVFVDTAGVSLAMFGVVLNADHFGPWARVGFRFWSGGQDHYYKQHVVFHSLVRFGQEYWYKDKGHVMEAKLIIKRKHTMLVFKDVGGPNYFPVLGGVVLLDNPVACPNGQTNANPSPAAAGTPVPVNSSQGDTWEVDVSQPYRILVQDGRPDRGVMLYPTLDSAPGCAADFCDIKNGEWYEVTLKIRFAKDITG